MKVKSPLINILTLLTLSFSTAIIAASPAAEPYISQTTVTGNLQSDTMQYDMSGGGCQPVQVTNGYSQDFSPKGVSLGESSVAKLASSDQGDYVSCTWKIDQYTLQGNSRTLSNTNYCSVVVGHSVANINNSCEPARGYSTVFVKLTTNNQVLSIGVNSSVEFSQE